MWPSRAEMIFQVRVLEDSWDKFGVWWKDTRAQRQIILLYFEIYGDDSSPVSWRDYR